MKFKILYLLAAVFLIQTMVSGCGKTDDNQDQQVTVNKKEAAISAEDSEKNIAKRSAGNYGIVNDTVIDVFAKADIQSERVTQGIFNQRVEILEEQGKWLKVKVIDGYVGWVKSKFIDSDSGSQKSDGRKFKVILTSKAKKLYASPSSSSIIKDIVMGTEFYSKVKSDGKYEVLLPDGKTGWIDEEGTIKIPLEASIPKTTAQDFVDTAKKFLGTGYLWGGVSSLGIDCSGLTYISSRMNGVDLPRDADKQYNSGEKVSRIDTAISGDLLFFSTNEDLKDISHVGIYLGSKQFLQASKSKGSVVIGSLEDTYFKSRLVGIKRIF
jgi:gamma-D-glutamyl-L-lysine dipeptidyl-peptidase